jgi:hypothetical protein
LSRAEPPKAQGRPWSPRSSAVAMRMSKDVAASQEAYRWMVDLSAVPPRLPNTRRVTAHHAADKRVPREYSFFRFNQTRSFEPWLKNK